MLARFDKLESEENAEARCLIPTYSYVCEKCQTAEDIFKKLADYEKPEPCKTCGKEMQRQMTAPPVHFKGNCWSRDNYTRAHITTRYKNGASSTVPYKSNLVKGEKA